MEKTVFSFFFHHPECWFNNHWAMDFDWSNPGGRCGPKNSCHHCEVPKNLARPLNHGSFCHHMCTYIYVHMYLYIDIYISLSYHICIFYIYIYTYYTYTSSTAQGGGGRFKNRKPIGEVVCCESRMAERSHWWTDRWLRSPLFLSFFLSCFLSFSDYLSI